MKVLCVAVLMVVLAPLASAQTWSGGPRLFSYQGVIANVNGEPLMGSHNVLVELYTSSNGVSMIYSEAQSDIHFTNGVFDLVIGDRFNGSGSDPAGQLPESVDFNQPYWLQITIDPGGVNEVKFPRQQILSAPYALNSERVNGIQVSAAPVAGNIFPLPMVNGKIDPTILPPSAGSTQRINTVAPDNAGAISLKGSGNITISNDPANHTININSIIDTIQPGQGLTINDSWPNGHTITLSILPGGITSNMIGFGAITNNHLATNSITQDKIMPTTDYTMVAVGTTAQRPAAPAPGMVRFNTTTNKFEGYDGTSWVNLN